jgi:amidophosphoribosyltransferase
VQRRLSLQAALLLRLPKANDHLRHPHIYGIDLASTSELIAYHRSSSQIAVEIGADEVIYQTLSDLIAACAEAAPKNPGTRQFEVGVFTGNYVTPLDAGYLEHLEEVRGAGKKRAQEKARQAVVNVDAVEEGLKSVTNGTDINHLKKVLLSSAETTLDSMNGTTPADEAGETQDPALHNINDYKR